MKRKQKVAAKRVPVPVGYEDAKTKELLASPAHQGVGGFGSP
jgi:hypothetical protein